MKILSFAPKIMVFLKQGIELLFLEFDQMFIKPIQKYWRKLIKNPLMM